MTGPAPGDQEEGVLAGFKSEAIHQQRFVSQTTKGCGCFGQLLVCCDQGGTVPESQCQIAGVL